MLSRVCVIRWVHWLAWYGHHCGTISPSSSPFWMMMMARCPFRDNVFIFHQKVPSSSLSPLLLPMSWVDCLEWKRGRRRETQSLKLTHIYAIALSECECVCVCIFMRTFHVTEPMTWGVQGLFFSPFGRPSPLIWTHLRACVCLCEQGRGIDR